MGVVLRYITDGLQSTYFTACCFHPTLHTETSGLAGYRSSNLPFPPQLSGGGLGRLGPTRGFGSVNISSFQRTYSSVSTGFFAYQVSRVVEYMDVRCF